MHIQSLQQVDDTQLYQQKSYDNHVVVEFFHIQQQKIEIQGQ